MSGSGRLEISLDAVRVGEPVRHELGDLSELVESIRARQIMQPILLTPDNWLVLGFRRLEAARLAGLKRIPFVVTTGMSDRLHQLLAIQDDNLTRKPLTTIEAAELYEELKGHFLADAARRQQAFRFGADAGGDSPPSHGKSRTAAARAVTGKDSHQQLERVLALKSLAGSTASNVPDWLRQQAATALEEIEQRGEVNGPYAAVMTEQAVHRLERVISDPERSEVTRQAAQAHLAQLRDPAPPNERLRRVRDALRVSQPDQLALLTRHLDRTQHWWLTLNPQILAPELDDEIWLRLTELEIELGDFVTVLGRLSGRTPDRVNRRT
ncbi:MAG TPA: ParB N-terminal domain-containing protein [Mycobacterium sp.]